MELGTFGTNVPHYIIIGHKVFLCLGKPDWMPARLSLLKEFYGHITVPPAVWREVVEHGGNRAGAMEVEQARQTGWSEVSAPDGADKL